MADTQVRQIRISVDTNGNKDLKALADQFGQFNKSAKQTADVLGSLKSAFNAFFAFSVAGVGIKGLADTADSIQNLQSRLKVLTGSSEGAQVAFDGIVEKANATKVSISDLGTTYTRLASVLKSTGLQTNTLLEVTEVLQNTFKLSGATAQEAANASVQLSQGLALGTLRGQDLRSVLSQNVVFGDLLAKQLNITRDKLYKFAEAGTIKTPDVFKAILSNAKEVNTAAESMAQTFEQTLTIAFNKFQVAVGAVNKEFDISGNFRKGVDYLIEKLPEIATVLGVLTLTQLPKLITQLGAVAANLALIAISNPISALITAFGALYIYSEKFANSIKEIAAALIDLPRFVLEGLVAVRKFVDGFAGIKDTGTELDPVIDKLKEFSKAISDSRKFGGQTRSQLDEEAEKAKKLADAQADVANKLKATAGAEKKLKEILGEINKEYLAGKLSVEAYNEKLDAFNIQKATRNFRDGKENLEKFSLELNKFQKSQIDRAFNAGTTSFSAFNTAIRENRIEELNIKLKSGKINLIEYNLELAKISENFAPGSAFTSGLAGYVESIGTTTVQVGALIKSTFDGLDEYFLGFIKTGTFNFAKFTETILDDLAKIILRATIIKPLAEGLLNYNFQGSASGTQTRVQPGTGNYITNAHGNVFDKGLRKFAAGGVVNSPTMFSYGQGKSGLMGEAGAEAILPLGRGANGDLGVQASLNPVTINIVNNAGVDVSQTESTDSSGQKTIDVIIQSKVKEGFASGVFDKTMNRNYGLRRQGV